MFLANNNNLSIPLILHCKGVELNFTAEIVDLVPEISKIQTVSTCQANGFSETLNALDNEELVFAGTELDKFIGELDAIAAVPDLEEVRRRRRRRRLAQVTDLNFADRCGGASGFCSAVDVDPDNLDSLIQEAYARPLCGSTVAPRGRQGRFSLPSKHEERRRMRRLRELQFKIQIVGITLDLKVEASTDYGVIKRQIALT